jgi:hypothetical protein
VGRINGIFAAVQDEVEEDRQVDHGKNARASHSHTRRWEKECRIIERHCCGDNTRA